MHYLIVLPSPLKNMPLPQNSYDFWKGFTLPEFKEELSEQGPEFHLYILQLSF